jgi:hypothetical protein
LVKRAAELRDILGLARCTTLLSRVLAQQQSKTSTDQPPSRPLERTSSSLRAEATEWTPPNGTDSPRTALKKVLNIHKRDESTSTEYQAGLLPPFVEYSPAAHIPLAPGTFYLRPPTTAPSDVPLDLSWDGKQFISSLAAKRDGNTTSVPQRPIDPPNKVPSTPPPGLLTPPQAQKPHSFPLVASLLPQTFSVHLLSALHMRFQHVSASLEMLDSTFGNELKKTTTTQKLNSTRWETWMSADGVAGMSRALVELRKALDELCGAAARAGWIVDTWGDYQGGKLDGSVRSSEGGLGSAAIDGVEIGLEAGMRSGLHAPIGRPHSEKGKSSSSTSDPVDFGENGRPLTSAQPSMAEKVVPIFSGTGTFRPPPGLAFPLKPLGEIGEMSRVMNGSRRFPSATCAADGNIVAMNGVSRDVAPKSTEKDRSLTQRLPSSGTAPLFDMAKIEKVA